MLSARSQIAKTLPHLSSSLTLCFKEGHYHVLAPQRFNSPIKRHSSTSVGAGQSMPLSLESNSPSDLNRDPILYLTYLHNGTGQEFFFPALPRTATLSFVGPLLLMLQNKQTLHAEVSRSPIVFIFLLRKQASPSLRQTCALSPAKRPRRDEPCFSPGCFFARAACLGNWVCKTLLGDGRRNGNKDTAEPDHKYLLQGPVTLFCTTPFARYFASADRSV